MPNQLLEETSPYLIQHADNPVNWYPWCEEALALAKTENKPILLSIGYSACHWCHVMAHESFEDPITAELMNKLFINIKVDREERPDLDKIYQTAHSLLTQRPGGWPLTVFLTPDEHLPIFAGTYFPKEPVHNMPAFSDVMRSISDAWLNKQQAIQQQNEEIKRIYQQMSSAETKPDTLNAMPIDIAITQLKQNYDSTNGGFGQAPKFPHPTHLELALQHWQRSLLNNNEDFDLLNIATHTLEKMALGGINDHIGGGFCRYSVDNEWTIPHFEKMLYDNGPLLGLYCKAYHTLDRRLFKNTALDIADWVMHEMQSDEGGYYSSQDADSESEEGKFYRWKQNEIKNNLSPDDYIIFADRYGLKNPPNFENKYWHLNVNRSLSDIAEQHNLSKDEVYNVLRKCKHQLYRVRDQRIHPGRDEKILTSWNALMIKGMSIAARTYKRDDILLSAKKAINFIQTSLWNGERLYATCKDGHAHLNAYVDDYAFLIDALIEYLQSAWNTDFVNFAIKLAGVLIDNFEDTEHGGLFFTSHDHEKLIMRNKPYADDSLPSGNSVAASALTRLGLLTGSSELLSKAENIVKAAFSDIKQAPLAHANFINSLNTVLNLPFIIILRCSDTQDMSWFDYAIAHNNSDNCIFIIPEQEDLPDFIQSKPVTGKICAYICQGFSCRPAITDFNQFKQFIDGDFNDSKS